MTPIPVVQIPLPEMAELVVEEQDEVEIIEINTQPVVEAATISPTVELTTNVMELEDRTAEIDALCRDFLLVGSVSDIDDVNEHVRPAQ